MKKMVLIAVLVLSACASSPDKMTASYVSPIIYQDYSCKQLAAENQRVSRRADELYATLKRDASNDGAQMAVGLLLFWPTLFFLEGGDGPQAVEYRRLKGERDAVEQVSIQKECGLTFQPFNAEVEKAEVEKTKPITNFNKRSGNE